MPEKDGINYLDCTNRVVSVLLEGETDFGTIHDVQGVHLNSNYIVLISTDGTMMVIYDVARVLIENATTPEEETEND